MQKGNEFRVFDVDGAEIDVLREANVSDLNSCSPVDGGIS